MIRCDFFPKNIHWFFFIFSRPTGASNEFLGSFERAESLYCRRLLIFKRILNKIRANLTFEIGTYLQISIFLYCRE